MLGNSKTAVIALGGNAISRESEDDDIYKQFANTRKALEPVAELVKRGWRIILTHGGGPQIGNMLLRVEESRERVPPIPLGVIVADLQGGMGYMIQQTLQNKLHRRGIVKKVITVISQVVVEKNDPAILNPSKFVGPGYSENEVEALCSERGWQMKQYNEKKWRRVVPSPVPLEVIGRETIENLLGLDAVVIACGGGGIPVCRDGDGCLEGVDAVIDKDLSSMLLAKSIGADALYISTAVDYVYLNFGKQNQRALKEMSVAQAKKWLADGQFPAGSMGPKVQAGIDFIESGGTEFVITPTEKLVEAAEGKAGTRIRADEGD